MGRVIPRGRRVGQALCRGGKTAEGQTQRKQKPVVGQLGYRVERSEGREPPFSAPQGGGEGYPRIAGWGPWDAGPSGTSDLLPTLNERTFPDGGKG